MNFISDCNNIIVIVLFTFKENFSACFKKLHIKLNFYNKNQKKTEDDIWA